MLAGIDSTQVGDPRGHSRDGRIHGISSDRFVGLAGFAVAEAEDEKVGDLEFLPLDSTEGFGHVVFGTELGPQEEDFGLGASGLSCGGLGGN